MRDPGWTIRVWVVQSGDRKKLVARAVIRDGTGATERKQKTLEATRRKAAEREAEKKWEDQLREEHIKPPKEHTWPEFLKLYREDYLPKTSRSNRRNWNTMVNRVEETAKKRRQRLWLPDITPELLAHVRTDLDQSVAQASANSYMATLRAGLNWAAEIGWMDPLPQQRNRGRSEEVDNVMRGRPLTQEEMERMLQACEKVFGKFADGWKDLIYGLYLSGLRLGDALHLHWDRHDTHHPVSLDGRRPKIMFTSRQKNRSDQLVAITPEFAHWLRKRDRTGWVFKPMTRAGRAHSETHLSRRISDVGRAAGVVTVPATEDGQKASCATAHDLRKSFGHRLAAKVMPPILMHLMRHRSIETTLRFYVGSSADQASRAVWEAWKTGLPQIDGAVLSSENFVSCDQACDQLVETAHGA